MNTKFYLLLTLICLPFLYFASQYASQLVLPSNHEVELLSVNDCEFGVTECLIIYQNKKIVITTANGLTTNTPMQIRVAVQNIADQNAVIQNNETQSVEIQSSASKVDDFANVKLVLQGKTMYMGIVQTQLVFKEKIWQGELYLPFCTTEKMDWVLNVDMVTRSGKQLQAQIEFQISHT